eukprot:3669596-Pleurochrysis_carterae.AAC.5
MGRGSFDVLDGACISHNHSIISGASTYLGTSTCSGTVPDISHVASSSQRLARGGRPCVARRGARLPTECSVAVHACTVRSVRWREARGQTRGLAPLDRYHTHLIWSGAGEDWRLGVRQLTSWRFKGSAILPLVTTCCAW